MALGSKVRARVSLGWLGCAFALAACSDASHIERGGERAEMTGSQSEDLYYASSKLWPTGEINVCWDNPTFYDQDARAWVQDQVTLTWQKESGVRFHWTTKCPADGARGIRIKISDETPHTTGLGTEIDGDAGGMVLNTTFENWSKDTCQSDREFCIRATAAHEFGHALGSAHEQNRPDTPSTCTDAPQGGNGDAVIGAWDALSIMNYCNINWNNGGLLSPTDILGVRRLYGLPEFRSQRDVDDLGYDAGGWRIDKHVRLLADVDASGGKSVVAFGDHGVLVATWDPFVKRLRGAGYSLHNAFGYADDAGGWRVDKHPRIMADVNGDHRADIVGFGEDGVYVSLAAQYTFAPPSRWVAEYAQSAGGWRVDKHPRFMADVNADNRADIVAFGDDGVWVSLSTGTGFTAPSFWLAKYGYNDAAGGWRIDKHPRFMADVNGDGRADIVGFANDGVYVSLSTGTGFTAPWNWVGAFGYDAGGWRVDQHPRFMADVNGDGSADVVGFANDGVYVALAMGGAAFGAPMKWVQGFGYNAGGWRVDQHPRFVEDVNGDGRADVVGIGTYGLNVALSNGSSFGTPVFRTRNFGYVSGWRMNENPVLVGDINNDHHADIVGFGDDGVWVGVQ